MDRDEQVMRESAASLSHAEAPAAIGRWLQVGLAKRYEETLNEPLPEAWLALLDAADEVRDEDNERPGQNNPATRPSAPNPIDSAAGRRGRPGMVMMSPHTATTNPAPADSRTSRTGSV
jgi:hypothetical protein